MRIYQIIINHNRIPEAAYTPLSNEVYGPFELIEANCITDIPDLVRHYRKRTKTKFPEALLSSQFEVIARDIPDTYMTPFGVQRPITEKELEFVYKTMWPSIDRCLEEGAFELINM